LAPQRFSRFELSIIPTPATFPGLGSSHCLFTASLLFRGSSLRFFPPVLGSSSSYEDNPKFRAGFRIFLPPVRSQHFFPGSRLFARPPLLPRPTPLLRSFWFLPDARFGLVPRSSPREKAESFTDPRFDLLDCSPRPLRPAPREGFQT